MLILTHKTNARTLTKGEVESSILSRGTMILLAKSAVLKRELLPRYAQSARKRGVSRGTKHPIFPHHNPAPGGAGKDGET